MVEIFKIIIIAGFGFVAYILGWLNAIRACEEAILCEKQRLLNFSSDFDKYILNEALVLKQIKLILEEDLNRLQKDQLVEMINKRIKDIEFVYEQKQVFFKEPETFEDLDNE